MSKQNFLFATAAFFCLLLCAGCWCCGYDIEHVPDRAAESCPVKFYVDSIETQYAYRMMRKVVPMKVLLEPEMESLKKDLLATYPNLFTDDKEKGVNVKFFWQIEYDDNKAAGMLSALLTGFSFGVLPCIITSNNVGNLTIRKVKSPSFSVRQPQAEEKLSYNFKGTAILHHILLDMLTDPIAAALLFKKSDIKSSYLASDDEKNRTPFLSCKANLQLFAAACRKFYDGLSNEEKQALDDIYNPQDIVFLTK